MLGTFATKLMLSLFAAAGMYWMRVPHAVILLMLMQSMDLATGSMVAILMSGLQGFSIGKFGRGVMLKAVAYPLLAACDLAEEPLRLMFHLDAYVALALVAYEFLSVVENYSRVRPLPKIVVVAAQKAQEWLSAGEFTFRTVENVTQRTILEPEHGATVVMTQEKTVTRETHAGPPDIKLEATDGKS